MTTTARHSRRALIGIVTSTKTKKTITVEVERTFKHAKYGKYLRKRKRYLAHDEDSVAKVGDNVELASTRPMSKRKRWRLLRVVTRSELGGIELPDAAAQIMADITGKPLGLPATGTGRPLDLAAGDTGPRTGTEAGQ